MVALGTSQSIAGTSYTPFSLIQYILKTLFAAETRRLQRNIDRIHLLNQEVSKQQTDGFQFQGKFYRWSQTAAGGSRGPTLHLSLWWEIQAHIADEEQIEQDRAEIQQTLFKLIEPCTNLQDVRDGIPDCIADVLPQEFAGMERMGSPIGALNHIRDIRQYNRVLPKIEFYAAARLLY